MEATQITYHTLSPDALIKLLQDAESKGEKRGYEQAKKELEKPVNAKQLAEWLGVDPSTVRRWTAAGEIPSHKIGGENRYYFSEVLPKKGRS